MNKKISYMFRLISVGLITFVGFTASAQAQCIPAVYAFRHAEDFNPPSPDPNDPNFGGPYGFLSRTGAAHADLYPEMIKALETHEGYCPVTRVYAASPTNEDGKAKDVINYYGAVNSFCTARPLAKSLSEQQTWKVPPNNGSSSTNPLCTNAETGNIEGVLTEHDPQMFINGVGLDEYLNGPGGLDDPGALLRAALLDTAENNQSSAIFWTSQGLHALGNAIINGDSVVPEKPPKGDPERGNIPGRNAVYIFTPKDTDNPSMGFKDTSLDYFQCFNWTNYKSDSETGRIRTNNWCGRSDGTKLGGEMENDKTCTLEGLKTDNFLCVNQILPENLPGGGGEQINGKICNTDPESGFIADGYADYVGYCTPP